MSGSENGNPGAGADNGPSPVDAYIRRLEAELGVTRRRLQVAVAELECANEELKSSNEEYQTVNEELHSTNEELEASQAELQALNEELQTVNGELAQRVGDLARANSDLKNLMESTQIATIFLDKDLRLRGFTPASLQVFHLVESDLGRPLAHFTAQVRYPELLEDARRVLETLAQVEREADGLEDDRRFLVRLLPYRSVENVVAGVVVTFLDITGAARAEAARRASERRLSEAQRLAGVGVWEWNLDSGERWWSAGACQLWGVPADAAPAAGLLPIHPDDRRQVAEDEARARRTGELDHEWRVLRPDGSVRWLAARGRIEAGGRRMLGVIQDVTERKQAETRLKMLLGELQHRVRNILSVVRSIVDRTVRSSSSLEELSAHLTGRLDSLARTQGVFTRTGDAAIELEELIRDELVAVAARDDQVDLQGPRLRLRREAAETLALAIHELTTNAVKYGALSGPGGRLDVCWRVLDAEEGCRRLSLQWRESGVRALDSRPSHRGFGRDLIERGLPYELDAITALEFARGGVRALIELPLTDRIAEVNPAADAQEALP